MRSRFASRYAVAAAFAVFMVPFALLATGQNAYAEKIGATAASFAQTPSQAASEESAESSAALAESAEPAQEAAALAESAEPAQEAAAADESVDLANDDIPGANGWVESGGQKYWYDDGVMAASKEVYDPSSNAWYWFDADGTMAHDKDVYLPAGGKWVRYDSDGHMVKGEDLRYGGWYHFDEVTGEMTKGVTYVVGGDGGKWVYYDVVTGQMAHGEAYVDYDAEHTGWYLFDQATGAMAHGFVDLTDAGKRVYYDAVTGVMARGQVCIGGSWYNFDDVTGAMVRGFSYIFSQQKWVYYSDDGAMQYGERCVDGEWYLLNASTGAVSYGWQQLADGRTVYYDGVSGCMCYGEQNIGGKSYTFDSATGALISGNGPDFTVPSEYVASSSFMDKVSSGQAKSVRLFGDSIFAGIGASEFDHLSDNALFTYNDWTYYEPMSSVSCAGNWLRWKVESYGASYVSDCVPTQGSMNFFSHLDSSLYGTEDYAVVVLGTNDRGAYESNESLADYVCYAERFLTRLSAIYGGNIVVLSSAPVEYETYNYSLESADQALSGLCASHGWDFGSLYKAFEHVRQAEGFDASCLYYDGTHLNDRGQEVLWAALRQVLHVS